MACKRSLVILFIFFSFSVYAQDLNYRIDIRYIQRLTWIGDEYAMRYEVIIERSEESRFTAFFRDFTDKDFIEVTLPPGSYRYQVIPYDFLNSPINVTEWMEFEVLKVPENTGKVFIQETSQPEPDKFDVFIGIFWQPFFPVYNAELFPAGDMSLAGAQMRFGIVYGEKSFINPGLELCASWNMFDNAQAEQSVQLITASLSILGQIRVNSRIAFNFRAGFGVSLLSDIQSGSIPKLDTLNVNIGVSFLALVMRNLYLEAGADLPQYIKVDHQGYFCPWIGIGVRF